MRGKVIPASFLKVEGWRTLVGAKDRIEELVGGQNPGPEEQEKAREEGAKERSDGEG